MNDATGENYSEDIEYNIIEEDDKYVLEMKLNDEYLENAEYPITIDPTLTWTGASQEKDAYVVNGSSYVKKNYYTSTATAMQVGKTAKGTARTYINFTDFAAKLKGKAIKSANLVCYEKNTGVKNQKISLFKVTGSWKPASITWNNKPANASSALASVKTGKVNHKKHKFNVKSYVTAVAAGKASNYGLVLINKSAAVKAAAFYGSRASSYKPKLTVSYYVKPKAPKVTLNKTKTAKGTDIVASFSGLPSDGLQSVSYLIQKKKSDKWEIYKSATKTRKGTSGKIKIPELSSGKYRVGIWGTNPAGDGAKRLSKEIIVDVTPPSIKSIALKYKNSKNEWKTIEPKKFTKKKDPLICVYGITDNYGLNIKDVSYAISKAGKMPTKYEKINKKAFNNDAKPYKLSFHLSEEEQKKKSGKYDIYVKVKDCVGHTLLKSIEYNKDNEAPEGSISFRDNKTNAEIEALDGVACCVTEINGTGSEINPTRVKLYKIKN
ncbi:MAG: DNRLRE domain-containing protein, partial [Alphaproteobacteria bacterium]|nr:DNRLRE domain-containing protein [Alphaproteobacteria bacterium]